MSALTSCEPRKVFKYFEEIAAIPHGSRNTKQISDYLVNFAKERELEHYQDDYNNVVIIQEATEGYENAAPIIIQGHMDMVCEKENDSTIDFEKDGLELYVEGDFLKAKKTTLGGDDGIAISYALAIMDSPEIPHPRLEVVITVDEEIGMLGAEYIDLSMLRGQKMLNIDSDVEGHFLTSCAGGMTVCTTIPVSYVKDSGLEFSIKVTGLEGGHSGSEIDKEHANANVIIGRVLRTIKKKHNVRLLSLKGGLKDNAIPRDSEAALLINEAEKKSVEVTINELNDILKKEYEVSDKNIRIEAVFGKNISCEVLDKESFEKVVYYLRNVPNGVLNMSQVMPGLVETSLNMGIVELKNEQLSITTSVRSSVSSRKQDVLLKLDDIAEFLGGCTDVSGDYPAWEYVAKSELRDIISATYKDLFGKEPVFEAIHAGLECGILSDKIPHLDCVSFGPDNFDIHTPRERLSISSTQRVWELIKELLKRSKG